MNQSTSREVTIGDDARKRLLEGAQMLCKAVSVTFGPKGRTVLLDRFGGLLTTKDGVTVAREVTLEDPIQNQGAQIIKEACVTVNEEVGDGTTTTAVLAAEILKEGHKLILAGMDPKQVIQGMRAAQTSAIKVLYSICMGIKTQGELEQVALIASNHDEEIAQNLAKACMAVGKDGTVSIEDSPSIECTLEFKEGMDLDKGAASPAFFEGNDQERVIEGPLVAVVNAEIKEFEDVREILETASQWPQNELIIFALGYGNQALTTMTINNKKGVLKCCALNTPGIGAQKVETLKDIAALSGADFCDPAAGYNSEFWDADWFGSLRKITIKHSNALLQAYPEARETLQQRIDWLKAEDKHSTSDYDSDRIKERLAKLSGGLAIFKVGGATETALKERRARVEDALGAVQAALREGVVPGGGSAYLAASITATENMPSDPDHPDYLAGYKAVTRALQRPVAALVENAGKSGPVVVETLRETMKNKIEGVDPATLMWVGYDILTDEFRSFNDLMDPTSVAIASIRAAVSVSSTLLTVEASIARKEA
jgi:chaperonin GroEL